MRLNCPDCNHKFRFLDLLLFRLKGYKIECKKCGELYRLDGHIDQLGILLLAILTMVFLAILGGFFKLLSNYLIFPPVVEIVIIFFIIIFLSFFVLLGHPAYLVWNIKKKYQRSEKKQKRKNLRNHTDDVPGHHDQ